MSYARLGCDGSDLYLYANIHGGWSGWHAFGEFHYETLPEVWEMLHRIKAEGQCVPDYVFTQIKEEMTQEEKEQKNDTRTI